ncbi:MAG: ATP-binding protein [Acidobacteria bacterium]|nr:ATP-binding protein [Acidobacteriota bacterium]
MREIDIALPKLVVLFGPNGSGKSNILDAIQALSRVGTGRTLPEALAEPIRGYAIEAFAFSAGGLPALLSQDRADFTLESDLDVPRQRNGRDHSEATRVDREQSDRFRYRITVRISPASGALSVGDEYLAALNRKGDPKDSPSIEVVEGQIRIRRKSRPAHPIFEDLELNHSILSNPRLGGVEYRAVERCRSELADWRTYYLDPRVSMRSARPPSDVRDIGVLGEDIAPFLYRLAAEKPKSFEAVKRTLKSLVPSVDDLAVDLDKKRGTLDVHIRHAGIDFSSRIISEGTLRVLALCALAVNPWGGSLLAFEEPENGVHPRRLELIAQLLLSISLQRGRQIVISTHSPLLCGAVLREARQRPDHIALLNVRREVERTIVEPFDVNAPLFEEGALSDALRERSEDGVFEGLMLRGLIGE